MVKLKLKTRKSTLGATREERILSSLASRSLYSSSKADTYSKAMSSYQMSPFVRVRRVGGILVEQRDEAVPTSITTDKQNFPRFPTPAPSLHTNDTSCSITTTESFRRDLPPHSSPSSLRRVSTFHANTRPPSPSRPVPRSRTRPSKPKIPSIPRRRSEVKRTKSRDSPSIESSALGSIISNAEKSFVERVELVKMQNREEEEFVRILVSKTSYKPQIEHATGVDASKSPKVKRRQSTRDRQLTMDRQPTMYRKLTMDDISTQSRDDDQATMPPILKTMDTLHMALCRGRSGSLESSICTGPLEPSGSLESSLWTSPLESTICPQVDQTACGYADPMIPLDNAIRRGIMTATEHSAPSIQRSHVERRTLAEAIDIDAHNYYGIHSLNKPQPPAKKKLFSFKKQDTPTSVLAYARAKEQARQEKKQRKEQKRLNKKSKKQIKKELQKEASKEELKRNESFNSEAIRNINYVSTERRRTCDDRIYNPDRSRGTIDGDASYSSNASSYSSGLGGILGNVMNSFASERERAGVPANVSYLSSAEEDFGASFDDTITAAQSKDAAAARQRTRQRAAAEEHTIWGDIGSDIGNVFGFGNTKTRDVRDLRMVDSDISSSFDENSDDESSSSSSGYYYAL